eukprot:748911-Hanusia_phi.AAC.4
MEEFFDIPEPENNLEMEAASFMWDGATQAEWARKLLNQRITEVKKMVNVDEISNQIADQCKSAREQLRNLPSRDQSETKFDPDTVAQQA